MAEESLLPREKSILAAFRLIRLHEHTHKHAHIYTHTHEEQLSKENILRLNKKERKQKESRKCFLAPNHHKQTNTQSKFNTMASKTRPRYSSGHDMKTHTGCDYRSTQATCIKANTMIKSSMTKPIWHVRLEGWNPTLGKNHKHFEIQMIKLHKQLITSDRWIHALF